MIPKQLDLIQKADIDALVDNTVPEDRTLDYKEQLPTVVTDEDKRKFAVDVAAFANALGGDIVYGVGEKRDAAGNPTGVPEAALGLPGTNLDAEITRLEQVARSRIEPRVPSINFRRVEGFANGPVLVMRIGQSWSPPHMVKEANAGTYRFYVRGANGNRPIDATEIRTLFELGEAVPQRIRQFRDERLARIAANETPVRLKDEQRVVLHWIPVGAMMGPGHFDIAGAANMDRSTPSPHGYHAWAMRYNLDGFVTYNGEDRVAQEAYFQVFRNGVLEAVLTGFVSLLESKVLASQGLEREVIFSAVRQQQLLQGFGMEPPLVLILSLLGVQDHAMALPRDQRFRRSHFPRFDRDTVVLPELTIEEYHTDNASVGRMLRPLFDTMWQASGLVQSPYYDEYGDWKPNRFG